MEEDKLLQERKEKIIAFLKSDRYLAAFSIISAVSLLFSIIAKISSGFIFSASIWLVLFICAGISAVLCHFKKHDFSFYPLLTWIIYVAVFIRTRNLPGLRDITTGGWTLGPDLDPFLFMRWAKDIVEHGSLMVHDAMRYVPLGFDTKAELIFLPYLIAWFHKVASWFGSVSVEQSAAIFPVFMFAITVIAFFLFARKIFLKSLGNTKSSIIALIASFFLSVIPVFLPRTIAGIPEKESAAFFFMFIAFYFFLSAWQAEKHWKRITLALLAGLSTAGMGLIWGGALYLFLIIGASAFISFLLGQFNLERLLVYSIWLISSFIFIQPFSTRYPLTGFISSPPTAICAFVFAIILVDFILFNTKLKEIFGLKKISKIPRPILSLIIAISISIVFILIFFGASFIAHSFSEVLGHLITPRADRFGVTVAENRQPFFAEWADNFGPIFHGFPITFWLFFLGSIFLFYKVSKIFEQKERVLITISYAIFLIFMIFSRYSAESLLNGTNNFSLFVYLIGFLSLVCCLGYYYYAYYLNDKSERFSKIEMNVILLFILFFISIISARGAIRVVMVLVPAASIIISYFFVDSIAYAPKLKTSLRWAGFIFIALLSISLIFAGANFYNSSINVASTYIPSSYNQQWQKAMSWVRESTPKDAVFTHWWDYGYWVQSIGERATMLDGGNAIVYWDHLMGRYGLTETNDTKSLELYYAHNVSYLLIDSSDIGKYPAFASIGSDDNYDRYSWINAMLKDERQTQETKNSTFFIYQGGTMLDEDIIYKENNSNIFLPGGKAGIAGVIIERDKENKILTNPIGIFVYQNKQYRLPLKYANDGKKLVDFNSGINAGVFFMPSLMQSSAGSTIDPQGAILYLSARTVKGELARLYLYNENNPSFKLAHTEDDFVVAQLKASNATNSDFVYYQGVRGPIKIWEIKYPKNIRLNPDYLVTSYPNINYTRVR